MIRWIGLFLLSISLYATPAQVLVIRHGEKNAVHNLSTQGLERAAALANYLTATPELLNWGPPVAIFGARQTANGTDTSIRIIQTATPISQFLALPIHLGFSEFSPEAIASYIVSNPAYNGKNVLIIWHSEGIPPLLSAFGFTPPAVTPDRYDITYILTFPHTPGEEASRMTQNLLYGDDPVLPAY